ncbi:MAG: 2-oxo acid dehydrogenase subunit E2 [Verrucomicrobiae bacterium]|nr:2-oxo acid dehydrogenase subunit E2 [Verrucomicrobiae bacterium]
MPDMTTANSVVKIVEWRFQEGQPVRRGDLLVQVETDKAAVDVESIASGVLKSIRARPGDEVLAGQVIAVIETADSAAALSLPLPPGSPPSPSQKETAVAVTKIVREKPLNSGAAKRGLFARNQEARLTEPKGNVAVASGEIPLSAARRIAARRMTESKQNIPHFYLKISAAAEGMIRRRNLLTPKKMVWDAFFIHAVGKALENFPQMACRFDDGKLVPLPGNAVGVAVDVEGDLYVLPVEQPSRKSPETISEELWVAVDRLRAGDASVRRAMPTRLTITNLGASGVEEFMAIINPPEAAILAVGKVSPTVRVTADRQMRVQDRVNLTLSVDHRVVNGGYATLFLNAIVKEIEAF